MRYRCRCEGCGRAFGHSDGRGSRRKSRHDRGRSLDSSESSDSWHQASAEALPFPDRAYDAVLCQMGLQFFSDKLLALSEARRVLRPRGRFVASVPSPIPPLFTILAEQLERHGQHGAAEFVRQVFSLGDGQLEELLDRAGFADISVTTSEKALRLPAPHDFLWQYVTSTPLGAFSLTSTTHSDVTSRATSWGVALVCDAGSLVLELRLVLASAVAP